ncbi:UbiA family prenyltransferase [Adhaeribacter rhizoryzae]|uniref:Prenyltransferase n=1 Tax=Adhaeribacter rhizoryzae TaxID=2607907 RepID=A0A5M6DMQ9_9BACT|nr:UbiA family prenyltransferase [Adhaeribacter rhizoryzae]KAA5548683.1 prenyltransferase [Adhaeribacter rhizoryzae]
MRDALKLMRIPFSVYLMPVFWFALSVVTDYSVAKAVAVFVIIHLFVYPASNGYNCYFDRDESSIGGLKHPPKVNKSLFWLVSLFDGLAILGALFISVPFAVCITVYLLVSKAYSYDKIRLKKYPFISTLVVIFFQGAFTFLMVQLGIGVNVAQITSSTNLIFATVSSLFLCGSYPLTQVYQHTEDARRGDKTISLLLGIQGTFLFSGISLLLGTGLLIFAYLNTHQEINILIFLLCTGPVVFFFNRWFWRVRQNRAEANFENTMLMNKISSLSISLAFMLMIIF